MKKQEQNNNNSNIIPIMPYLKQKKENLKTQIQYASESIEELEKFQRVLLIEDFRQDKIANDNLNKAVFLYQNLYPFIDQFEHALMIKYGTMTSNIDIDPTYSMQEEATALIEQFENLKLLKNERHTKNFKD